MSAQRKFWSEQETQVLLDCYQEYGPNWKKIAKLLPGRNPSQCIQRWKRIKPFDVSRQNKWTKEEDKLVVELYRKYKTNWKQIADHLTNRNGQQVRDRYINHLDPSITNRDPFTEEEDEKLWQQYQIFGPKWVDIAQEFKGRSVYNNSYMNYQENMLKNRFYSRVRSAYGKIANPYYVKSEDLKPERKRPKKISKEQTRRKLKKQEKDQKFVVKGKSVELQSRQQREQEVKVEVKEEDEVKKEEIRVKQMQLQAIQNLQYLNLLLQHQLRKQLMEQAEHEDNQVEGTKLRQFDDKFQ